MSFYDRSKGNKALLQSMRDTEGLYNLVQLSDRHIQALLSITEYLKWGNRYSSLPDEFSSPHVLGDWASGLEERLMHPYEEGQEVPIDCESAVNCIIDAMNNNQSFRDLFAQKLTPMILNRNNYNNYITNITYPTPSQPIIEATNGKDLIWARCVAIVEFVHRRITDMMNILEVQSNNIELLKNFELIPIIGTLFDEIQADVFLDFADYALSTWSEQYNSNWSEDPPVSPDDPEMGSKWVLCCALFCLCESDGVFTVDRINEAFLSCFVGGLPSLENIAEFAQFIIGINDDNPNVVYGTFVFVWGIARITSMLVNVGITDKFLGAILRLTDEGNNDWEIYCQQCIAPGFTLVTDVDFEQEGGTITGPVNGVYTVTSTYPASFDHRLSFRDSMNRPFKIIELTYPDGMSAAQVWKDTSDNVIVKCCGADFYNIEGSPAVKGIVFTRSSPFSITFKVVEP